MLEELLRASDRRFADISGRLDSLAATLAAVSRRRDPLPPVLGAPCRTDTECSELQEDAECGADGRCRCGEGLQEVVAGRCLPYPRLSEPCRRDADCLGAVADSACTDGVCACRRGLLTDAGACRRARLSEVCTVSEDCDSRRAMCDGGHRCSCRPNYWNDGNITCRAYPRLDESCNSTAQCHYRTSNAACVNGVCTCAEGFWKEFNNEVKTADGVVRGSYSYVDSYGIPQKVSYVSDALGFRVAGTNLPVGPSAVLAGPAPVADTPEVAAAKSAHFAAHAEALARAAEH
ncbi:Cuticle protein 7 [Amphibalanus amphitrite]|uniref:Cuticle protein 7 n=1 Tax=Amphibalanus amphitrite TaxID=1232801 RepID=A0A6A4X0T3_AMPAM|nr:Cuticle protein 7 [Amphibalanus amphitrite]